MKCILSFGGDCKPPDTSTQTKEALASQMDRIQKVIPSSPSGMHLVDVLDEQINKQIHKHTDSTNSIIFLLL